ncbi:hypothetical protein N431DRAFT_562410 [Stipitochalara longipes BDJ]|nr:hypothetical protein N431DRAFT_562410 [Stipitochalara longipes BDJ]
MATGMTTTQFLEKYKIKKQILQCMQNATSAKAFISPHLLHDVWTDDCLSRFLDTLKPEDTSDFSVSDAFGLLYRRMLAIISILVYIGWDDWTRFWPNFISFDPFTTLCSTERRSNVLDRYGSTCFDRLDDFLPFEAEELEFLEGQAQQFLDAQYIFKPIIIFEYVDGKNYTHSSLERLPFIKKRSGDLGEGAYGKVTREVVAIRCLYHRTSASAHLNPNLEETPLAVKQFGSTFAFRDEWENLRQLALSLTQHEHVLSFISIIVLEQEGVLAVGGGGETNCHILMPLANMDLWSLLSDDSETIQLDLSEVLRQSRFLLDGLKFLHQNLTINGQSRNCSHGDLKPRNILVYDFRTPEYPVGHWRIADFGLSTIKSGKKTSEGPTTLPGYSYSPRTTLLSSAYPSAAETGYQAPEKDISPRSDVWSMGCINFWTLFRVQEDASRLKEMDSNRGLAADGHSRFGDDYFYRREPADSLVVNPHIMGWLMQPSITESSNGIVSGWSKVITKMLVVEPMERISSSEAGEELATLLSQESGMSENYIEHRSLQQQAPNSTTQKLPSHANFPLQESISQISPPASLALKTSQVGPRYIPAKDSTLVSAQKWEEYLRDHQNFIQDVRGTEILNWLSNFNYSERHKLLLQQWHPGTLWRIFQQKWFLDWSNSTENSNHDSIICPPILWYYGGPGVGKSVMVSQIVKHLVETNSSQVAILYLFCDYKDRAKQKLLELMLSLVKQAAEQVLKLGPLPAEIVNAYQRDPNGTSKLDLGECRMALIALLKLFERSFILLDGLDEYVNSAGESKVTKPIELLEKLHEVMLCCGDSCRMLLTSREPTLAFHKNINATRIPIRANSDDVRSFVSDYILSREFNLNQMVKADKELESLITDRLTQRADGQFLLPILQLRELEEDQSPRDLKEHLDRLPVELFDYYQIALDRIGALYTISSYSEPLGFKILGFLLQARCSLTLEAFQHALAVRLNDKAFIKDGIIEQETLLSHTFGLLTIQENKVQFVHHTVHEFLKEPEIYKYFSKSEQDFALTCMTYISFQNFASPCDELQKLYSEYPFLEYAADQFGYHASEAIAHSPNTEEALGLSSRFEDFLKGNIPLGTLQVFASKVLQRPLSTRIDNWRKELPILHLAILMRLDAILKDMLKNGADIEEQGYKKETPLHMAARCGNKTATKLLLDQKADVNKTNYSGKNALDMIMQGPYLRVWFMLHDGDFIKYLLSIFLLRFIEASLMPQTEFDRRIFTTPMSENDKTAFIQRLASEQEDKEKIQARTDLVLGADVRIDITDEQEELVHILINEGIDLNSTGSANETPLQCATIYGRKEIVLHLLEKKANPWLDYTLGRNALELAQNRPRTEMSSEIMKIMEDKAMEILKEEELELDEEKKLSIPGPRQAKHLLQLSQECAVQRYTRQQNYGGGGILELMNILKSIRFSDANEQAPNNDQAPEVKPQDQPQEQTQCQSRTLESEVPGECGLEKLNLNEAELLSTEPIHFRPSISTSLDDFAPPDTPPPSMSEQSRLKPLPMAGSFNLPESQTSKRRRTPGLDELTLSISSMGASQAKLALPDTPHQTMPTLSRDPSDMDNLLKTDPSATPRKRPRISPPDKPGEA